jgi:hypothetical protein
MNNIIEEEKVNLDNVVVDKIDDKTDVNITTEDSVENTDKNPLKSVFQEWYLLNNNILFTKILLRLRKSGLKVGTFNNLKKLRQKLSRLLSRTQLIEDKEVQLVEKEEEIKQENDN